ncbi:MAG TPA: thiolase family protein [Mycobacteriales bacterium]|jgi:acetyl-CoA C-acetyltransferase|nr:thiolase family protein [Cryptosporangiaceae bacterium]MDQ1676697.1 acetyl-CoA C-acetyltransferase [Actinomycetota bacterium]HEV7755333.1 thiolase family protein [Mycobacteriales bacterium]
MRDVAIVGAGMIPFGELFDQGIKDMVARAFDATLSSVDKGMRPDEIGAAWFSEVQSVDGFPAGLLADACGLGDIPVTRVENACASGNDALRNALYAVGGGYVDVALVLGTDKVRDTSASSTFWDWMGTNRDSAWDLPLGLISPASFALHVARYMHEFGATREHLAMVAVKNHHNGATNPYAHLRYEVTMEQVLAAPMVVEPFGLLDCVPQSDGAAAVLIAGRDVVDRYTDRPVWVRGVGTGMDRVLHAEKADLSRFPATAKAAKQAFAMAGIGPERIDVAEVHDCFTGVEMMTYEELGFCGRGEAPRLLERGETSIGGRLPVNPSGGLKSKGHPPGATGLAQCTELFEQLRGEAVNQVDGARWALAHNVGGPTAVAAVTVLAGPDA